MILLLLLAAAGCADTDRPLVGLSLLALASSSSLLPNSSARLGPGRALGRLSDLAFALVADRDLSLVAGSTGALAGS